MIFWVLASFSVVMLVACWLWLSETHPPERRIPMNVASLVGGNWEVIRNPHFALLCAATCFGFGSLFLYISSAPVFILDILGLNQQQFAWFFVPMISGFLVGAFLSGRMAGRVPPLKGAMIGFACSGIGLALNLAYNLAVDEARVPWAVMPMILNTIGMGIAMPALTLAALDMYPHRRGSAASMHSFTMLAWNTILAGAVSPLVSHHRNVMATVAVVMWAVGLAMFWWWLRVRRVDVPEPLEAELAAEQGAA
jgi:DHA1 family bicyclomycin/chloramphenicol resistance-like MFS transporter